MRGYRGGMGKIVFGVHGLRSALNNTSALARHLVDRGHEVVFVSFRDVRETVEHVGARFVLLEDGGDAIELVREQRSTRGDWRSVRRSRQLRNKVLELHEPIRVLQQLAPDVVVVDMEMHGLVLTARHLGLPTILTLSWHDPMRSPSRPPMHRDLTGSGIGAGALNRLAWTDLIVRRRLRQALGPLLPSAARAQVLPQMLNTTDLHSVRAMARNLDVDLDAIASRHEWVHPHTYVDFPVISFTVKELEFDQTSPPGVTHIGPCIDPSRFQRALSAEARTELSAFLARHAAPAQRLAYCSMGSLQAGNQSYYQTVIDAFRERTEWGVILGLGSRGSGLHLDLDPERALVLDDAPQLEILSHADVAIHPGGASTFYECLSFQVPSVILHTGKTDMPGIAARMRHFGLGVVRDRSTVTADQLGEDAAELAGGASADALERIARVISEYQDRAQGVSMIESMLTE